MYKRRLITNCVAMVLSDASSHADTTSASTAVGNIYILFVQKSSCITINPKKILKVPQSNKHICNTKWHQMVKSFLEMAWQTSWTFTSSMQLT
ncbi:hypothetical protein RRG08_006937 [Elysia crispata]|uniref:Uncharacterized protein n=1 Tax=Elysia crispata TaxID=231223 RepID=A0AAE1D6X9_9GAST|nr:hypothetical protein RRG08_006937 [Elysia crispata]